MVAKKNITCGEYLTEDMLTWKRPGSGITADKYESVLGKRAKVDILEDTVLQYEMLENN